MLLIVDIGNTNINFAVSDNQNITNIFRLETDITLSKDDYKSKLGKLSEYDISGCIIASVVVELSEIIKESIDDILGINSIIFDSAKMNTGITIVAPHPEQAGADRIANTLAARKYPKPLIVVDLGSATTFDIVDKNGCFSGGVIMPGINMQLKALKDNTSLLPEIKASASHSAIGNDTESCILSGVIRGHACAIEGLLKQCEREIGEKVYVVATGGLSGLVSDYMDRKFDEINPNLTLEGIKMLYELNK